MANEQLKIFNLGDIVVGKVIEIEKLQALIKIESLEPIYVPKKAITNIETNDIEEILKLNRTYEFLVVEDRSSRFYNYGDYYLSIIDLQYGRARKRIQQLIGDKVITHTKVIEAYDYGVLVDIESEKFIVSNIHLKTKKSNKELVGTIIPLKISPFRNNYGYDDIVVSHRWALLNNKPKKQKLYAYGNIVIGKIIELQKDNALVDVGAEKLAYVQLRDMSYAIEHYRDVLNLDLIREFIVSTVYYEKRKTLSLSIIDLEHKIGWQRL